MKKATNFPDAVQNKLSQALQQSPMSQKAQNIVFPKQKAQRVIQLPQKGLKQPKDKTSSPEQFAKQTINSANRQAMKPTKKFSNQADKLAME